MGTNQIALRPSMRRGALMVTVATAAMLCAHIGLVRAADDPPAQPSAPAEQSSNAALLKKLQAMEERIKSLEGQIKQKSAATPARSPQASVVAAAARDPQAPTAAARAARLQDKPSKPDKLYNAADAAPKAAAAAPSDTAKTKDKPILGLADSPVAGLSIGAYGEVKFGSMQNPAANGQWQNGFDTARFVLLPTYAITDNIIFNAEIEFEHAGAGFDNDDKLHGTAEIEQVWIDFKIVDQFNWRAPGVDLVPIGYINQHHEPTQFYSVNRPELYNGLIPSTWKVPATSVYGTITDGVKYQVMLSTSNEDFGDAFVNRTAANTVPPFPTPYFPGIAGVTALAFSNPPLGSFAQLSNTMAVSGRLDVSPPPIPGLAWSVSGYYSPNTTPRGAHGDLGNMLGPSSLGMFDAEFRYRVPDSGFELRGEGVYATFGNPANLRANNDTDPTNNVGKTMYGYSGEVAYHVPLGTILHSEWEAVPFYRYTYQNFQTAGFAGTDLNMPTGAGQMQFHSAGVAVFPSPNLVLKATYQKVINRDPAGANADSVLGGVGFFF
jgi:hypothetical protein